LKKNEITGKTLETLSKCLSDKSCAISEIDISGCPLYELISLSNVIKESSKLEILRADNCGINMNKVNEVKFLLECCEKSKLKKLSLKQNEQINSL
jgi:hypothetical protein